MRPILYPIISFIYFLAGCNVYGQIISSRADTIGVDTSRYDLLTGVYSITASSFPVKEITIYRKDTSLAFKAGTKTGDFQVINENSFGFSVGDYEGTVSFRKDAGGKALGLLVFMNGEMYDGEKKEAAGSKKKRRQ